MRCWAGRASAALRGRAGLVLSGEGCAARVAVLMGGLYASGVGVARVGCNGGKNLCDWATAKVHWHFSCQVRKGRSPDAFALG